MRSVVTGTAGRLGLMMAATDASRAGVRPARPGAFVDRNPQLTAAASVPRPALDSVGRIDPR